MQRPLRISAVVAMFVCVSCCLKKSISSVGLTCLLPAGFKDTSGTEKCSEMNSLPAKKRAKVALYF
jgi:hypothetical protein